MLDVHPPHQAAHGWKDFFIHIATIVVGLIIAVGLEQSVEAWRHHHAAAELREQLHAESEQILSDAQRVDVALGVQVEWLARRTDAVRAHIWNGQPLQPEESKSLPDAESPDIPIWRSAKSAGETVLLHKGEINAFAEVEYLEARIETMAAEQAARRRDLRSFARQYPALPNGAPDFTRMSPEDLRTYLKLLTATTDATVSYRLWIRNMIGAETAVLAGKTRLEDLYHAEREAKADLLAARENSLQ